MNKNENWTVKVTFPNNVVTFLTGTMHKDVAEAAAEGIKERCKDALEVKVYFAREGAE